MISTIRCNRSSVATPVVDEDDEVRNVPAHLRTIAIWHLQPEIVILHVRSNAWVRFGDPAEFGGEFTMRRLKNWSNVIDGVVNFAKTLGPRPRANDPGNVSEPSRDRGDDG